MNRLKVPMKQVKNPVLLGDTRAFFMSFPILFDRIFDKFGASVFKDGHFQI
jgi:hypothetical protein